MENMQKNIKVIWWIKSLLASYIVTGILLLVLTFFMYKFELNEKIIYIGDSLTENGYEFYVHDLLKIIPYLMNDIPQHHYFVSDDATKLIYVSFENEIYFGECNLSKAEL